MAARVGVIFHGIDTKARVMEPGEAPYWVTVARFEAILDRIAALPDPLQVRISFDDGNASDMEIAVPRLLEGGLSADVVALTGRVMGGGLSDCMDQRPGHHVGQRLSAAAHLVPR